jgi:hypothetical protein
MLPEFKSRTIRAGGNAKTVKGDSVYQTAIMYLAPHRASGAGNVCPSAELAGCIVGCLFKAGRAAFTPSINPARVAKTQRYFENRGAFMAELVRDIGAFVRHCDKLGVKPAVRLNGTSDIQWEVGHPCERQVYYKGQYYMKRFDSIFEAFPEVQFYDYTKIMKRAYRQLPVNYALTLSYSNASSAYGESVIKAANETGLNVAIVYRSKAFRDSLMGGTDQWRPIINGDETDMRFLDPKGVIVGLYAKGPAKKDTSGFVVG